MLRSLLPLLVLTTASADTPTEQLVEEIAELRERVGEHGEVVADREDFAEALRGVAQQAGHAEANERFLRTAAERPT